MFATWWTDSENVVHLYNGILSTKKTNEICR